MGLSSVEADAGSGGAKLVVDTVGANVVPVSKLDKGVAGSSDLVSTGNGLPVELEASTAEIGKLGAGVAEIGNVKNSGTFAVQSTLQAGTAEVGKLAAGTAEIGNVKNSGTFAVQSTIANGAIIGPADPSIDSYAKVALSENVGVANEIMAAPGADKQIWIYGIFFSCDTAATSVLFHDEDDAAATGTMLFAQYGGLAESPSGNFAQPLWKIATNKAFEVTLVTGNIDGTITYAIVSV
jgi:hypothetical protein